MKAQSLATLVAVAASLQGVVATGWHNFPPFDCPGKNPPHTCVPDQHGGFDWKDLLPGPFDHFGGFDFSGFTCKRSFGKRGEIVERTFGDSKCITGVAHSDKNKCPKIRGNKVDKFSITHIKVSVEFDCDLEFHYTLPDNSVCKQKSHCKKSGTVVKNDQCGGAKDVTVVYPKPKHGGKDHCNIGIHHIDFDCPPTTTSSAVQSTTTSPPDTTETGPDTTAPPDTTTETGPDTTAPPDTTTETGPDTTAPPDTTTETGPDTTAPPDTTTETGPDTTAPPDTTTETGPDTTAPPDTTTETGPDTTSPPDTTTETGPDTTAPPDTTTETGPDTTSPPDNTEGPSTVITTVITDVTVTTCPVTKTHVTSGVTSIETTLTTSTILITTTKTVCHRCTGKPQPPQTTGGSSPGGVPCPDILPQCIKTWLPVECKSNSDTACFCPKKDFTDKLFECLAAHGATDDEIDDAAEYFQGICAPYVPTNPGIVTACPPKGTGGSKPHTVPVTTITVHTTVTVPCEPTGTETATSFTLTTISTEVTVPQVTLTSTTGGVVIVTGPATVGATATPAPVFTTVATVPGAASGTNSRPTATSPPFNSGASRGYVGAGLLGAVMAVAALFV